MEHSSMNFLFKEKTLGEIIRFGIVGVFATLLHYFIYWVLQHWINLNVAYTIGYALSFVCNFFLTSYFTFKKEATVKRGIGFSGAHLFNYLFQMVLLNIFISIGLSNTLAPIPVYMIAVPVNFIIIKKVFKK